MPRVSAATPDAGPDRVFSRHMAVMPSPHPPRGQVEDRIRCSKGMRRMSEGRCARCLRTDQRCREVHAGVRNHPPMHRKPALIKTCRLQAAAMAGAPYGQAATAAAAAAAYSADAAAAAEMASPVFRIAGGGGMLAAACRRHLGMGGQGGMMDAGRRPGGQKQRVEKGRHKQPRDFSHALPDRLHLCTPSVPPALPVLRNRPGSLEAIRNSCAVFRRKASPLLTREARNAQACLPPPPASNHAHGPRRTEMMVAGSGDSRNVKSIFPRRIV